ncbi:hypothetical protein DO97_16520 [Neosynechococcus sphagnicola sy1]|uniref:Uncharacterized protein n=1 Tax=Neosynechococcus sphagnicola sy1 TaxID=1497020 RepID=A0A098TI60_9CYAN|nr:hypothetical protein [Neosynechococcus sphagnicola]KGF71667.1 hypothetical protein DO97_16520 [Neosynechococcus sphagnicola sy1]
MPSPKAKGKRPIYLNTEQTDQLLSVILALMGEVSVVRERLDTLERLLEAKGVLSRSELENYVPDGLAEQERALWRTEYLARMLRVLRND